MTTPLRLAVQKSGRLLEGSLDLLDECGIELERGRLNLKSPAGNFPLEAYFLRDDDIPGYVGDRSVDAGIIGLDTLTESGVELPVVERLGFARCRLSIAVPAGRVYRGPDSLNGLRIATSHPRILGRFLAENAVRAEVHEVSGSVEISPAIGVSDVICDLVSTGSTLASNGLTEVETIFRSEAVLVAAPGLDPVKTTILDDLRFRIRAVLQARRTKYIMLNAPNEALDTIVSLLPGAKSPSIVPLAEAGWSSLHSVVEEGQFWQVIETLKAAGAEGILVLPIEKIIR